MLLLLRKVGEKRLVEKSCLPTARPLPAPCHFWCLCCWPAFQVSLGRAGGVCAASPARAQAPSGVAGSLAASWSGAAGGSTHGPLRSFLGHWSQESWHWSWDVPGGGGGWKRHIEMRPQGHSCPQGETPDRMSAPHFPRTAAPPPAESPGPCDVRVWWRGLLE